MDVKCRRCLEPWDIEELHYVEGMTFDQARRKFYRDGCGVVFNGSPCRDLKSDQGHVIGELQELLGDDIDGLASMLEDFRL